jgi:ubiquinone/menaquinone biosynthesis C-methylase UbiE
MEHDAQANESYLPRGFRDVDAAASEKIVQCLRFMDSLPTFQTYKKLILEALHPKPGETVADLGCGLGFDVLRLAELLGPDGCAIGVDSSMTLLRSARSMSQDSGPATFLRANIQNLPLANDSLHSCTIDRVLQHVESPLPVLSEVFRATRPGGVVACAEPDWGTFTIDHNNRVMMQQILDFWTANLRNPWIGRQLSNYLREAGFVDIQLTGTLLVAPSFESSDKVFDIVQTAQRLAESTGSDEPLAWISELKDRDRARPVCSTVTLFLNVARKPLPSAS